MLDLLLFAVHIPLEDDFNMEWCTMFRIAETKCRVNCFSVKRMVDGGVQIEWTVFSFFRVDEAANTINNSNIE